MVESFNSTTLNRLSIVHFHLKKLWNLINMTWFLSSNNICFTWMQNSLQHFENSEQSTIFDTVDLFFILKQELPCNFFIYFKALSLNKLLGWSLYWSHWNNSVINKFNFKLVYRIIFSKTSWNTIFLKSKLLSQDSTQINFQSYYFESS